MVVLRRGGLNMEGWKGNVSLRFPFSEGMHSRSTGGLFMT
jgi:hypothetical protein